jgi:hypothetical protein
MATASKDKIKTTEFEAPEKLNTHDFIKAILKEMLLADNDTLTLEAEIKNPDSTKATIKFSVKIEEVSTK